MVQPAHLSRIACPTAQLAHAQRVCSKQLAKALAAELRPRRDVALHGIESHYPLLRQSQRLLCMAQEQPCLASCVANGTPDRPALIAPQQGIQYTYEELDQRSRTLAKGLHELGYRAGSVLMSNVPNVAENIVLQVALSHIGASLATPRKGEELEALRAQHDVRGALVCDAAEAEVLPWAAGMALPTVSLEAPPDGSATIAFDSLFGCPPRRESPAAKSGTLLGIFGSAKLSNGEALALGEAAANRLGTTSSDRACVSVTLFHAFGIGSAACSAFLRSGAVVLPAVGGIKGCGDPQQRAAVTLDVLQCSRATQLFADTHTLRAMPAAEGRDLSSLRTGVVKIGSGSDFLDNVHEVSQQAGDPLALEYAGVRLIAMGKGGRH